MGMSNNEVMGMIELGLWLCVMMGGIGIGVVVGIGIVGIGWFIGGGRLGEIIIGGRNSSDGTVFIVGGGIGIGLIGILIDIGVGLLEKKLDGRDGCSKEVESLR
ncbi:hypothetical protein [Staphylococcus hominis]|uniref:hypothetical protein n=1 Tax=Staphylococcus hominis TaxID=1290 RepID=UPI0011A2C9F9|nr:hypothetical protein [Staphylococcus hominis]